MTKQHLSLLKPAARYLRHNHSSVFYRLEDLYRWGQDLQRFRFPLEDYPGSLLAYAQEAGLAYQVEAPATVLDRPPSCGISEDLALIGSKWKDITSEDNKGPLYMTQLRSQIRHPIEAAYKVQMGPCFVSPRGDIVVGDKTPLRVRKYTETHHSYGIDEAKPVEGEVVSLLSTFATSFSHWILDSLLKLMLIPRSERGRYQYLVPGAERSFLLPYLELFGVDASQVIRVRSWVQCKSLLALEVAHRSNMPHPAMLRRLRKEFNVPDVMPGHRNIFIGRRRRCLTNEREIFALASDYDFEFHYLEDLSLREQISLFGEAAVITGYHGAGFINMLFAPQRAHVLEIMNPAKWDHAYVRVAAALGFRHWHICTSYRPGVWDAHLQPSHWTKILKLIFERDGGHELEY